MKTLLMAVALLTSTIVGAVDSLSTEKDMLTLPHKINLGLNLASFDTDFIALPYLMNLDRVVIKMKHSRLCLKTTRVEISFDGESKQSFKLESGWSYRSYVASAKTTARSIEVRSVRGCEVQIDSVSILQPNFKPGKTTLNTPISDSFGYVSYAYEAFKYIENQVGNEDRINFVTPSIVSLSRALAVLRSVPETSMKARESLEKVLAQLQADQPFFEKLLSIESSYQLAVELMTTRAQIEAMLK